MNSVPFDHALRHRITDLMTDYVHCIDDDRLEEWPDFFADPCTYHVISKENYDRGLPLGVIFCTSRGMLIDRISSLRRANIYEAHIYNHMFGAVQYQGEAGGVHSVKSNFQVIRTMLTGETMVFMTGRMYDKIVEIDGALKYQERIAVFDSKRVDTLMVIPV